MPSRKVRNMRSQKSKRIRKIRSSKQLSKSRRRHYRKIRGGSGRRESEVADDFARTVKEMVERLEVTVRAIEKHEVILNAMRAAAIVQDAEDAN